VIHRGVAPKDFPRGYQPSAEWLSKWQTEHPQLAGKKILLLPGRITRWKGQEDFIHLIAALRANETDAHGLIAGEVHKKKHNFLTELRKLTAKLGVEHNITFLGHRNDLQEIMAVSNIVYSLSLDPEAFGRVTLEAVGIGCPVIGYDHGGVAEQLAKLYPRGLVTVGDRVKLLNKTLDLLSQPEKPANISAPFTLEDMKIATIDVYRELLDT
jgi:glycosyltransferase involved in cell wall biosynthesis